MLSPAQVDAFWEQGFVIGIPILTTAQVQRLRHHFERLEAAARQAAGEETWCKQSHTPWADPGHPLWRLFRTLSTHPRILSTVSCLIGPDLCIRNADVFIKEPHAAPTIDWHLDSSMPWSGTRGMVNAWLGLTPSTLENGCLHFIPQTHNRDLVNGPRDKEHLTLEKSTLATLMPSQAVPNIMPAGWLSLHTFRTPHRSGQNRTEERRIGYVTRFVSTATTPEAAESRRMFFVRPRPPGCPFTARPDFPISWRQRCSSRER